MLSPRPVPPRPCSCPRPTCWKTFPSRKVSNSLLLRPIPVSTTRTCTRAHPSRVCFVSLKVTETAPRGSVNLRAFDMPLLRHWCRRFTSPMNTASLRLWSMGTKVSSTFLSSACELNTSSTPLVSWPSVKARCTSTSLPESIRSKSSMSFMMFSMVVTHERSASTCLTTILSASVPAPSLLGVPASLPISLFASSSEAPPRKDSPMLRMVRRGERRSCITTLMSLARAAIAASAWCALRYSSSSCFLTSRHSGIPSMMMRLQWRSRRSDLALVYARTARVTPLPSVGEKG
mmetsp:Transcript_19806/g.46464  ORF Transcript_19806/g.46464 Transcript_19806/m.46464 type:complete len:290 (-) Transcript_19806:314-1183(-)